VVDQNGRQLLSLKVASDEAWIEAVIGSVTGLGGKITWAIDIIGAPSARLLGRAQPGRPACAGFRCGGR